MGDKDSPGGPCGCRFIFAAHNILLTITHPKDMNPEDKEIRKRTLLIMVIIVVVIAAIGGGVAAFIIIRKKKAKAGIAPGYPQPGQQPYAPQPGYAQPGQAPGTAQPGYYAQPGAQQPHSPQSDYDQPGQQPRSPGGQH